MAVIEKEIEIHKSPANHLHISPFCLQRMHISPIKWSVVYCVLTLAAAVSQLGMVTAPHINMEMNGMASQHMRQLSEIMWVSKDLSLFVSIVAGDTQILPLCSWIQGILQKYIKCLKLGSDPEQILNKTPFLSHCAPPVQGSTAS